MRGPGLTRRAAGTLACEDRAKARERIKMLKIIVIVAVVGFFVYRTRWVEQQKADLFSHDKTAYKKLPSFGSMIARFWIWDIKDFVE